MAEGEVEPGGDQSDPAGLRQARGREFPGDAERESDVGRVAGGGRADPFGPRILSRAAVEERGLALIRGYRATVCIKRRVRTSGSDDVPACPRAPVEVPADVR
ncbi:hypothetical protein AB0D89_22050 [Streptomyces luteogriseus]|uniref:hypothetical protein n=1 Tax=Streptomyces luteogriseus TaxID=68233 RepID=UPI0033C8A20D